MFRVGNLEISESSPASDCLLGWGDGARPAVGPVGSGSRGEPQGEGWAPGQSCQGQHPTERRRSLRGPKGEPRSRLAETGVQGRREVLGKAGCGPKGGGEEEARDRAGSPQSLGEAQVVRENGYPLAAQTAVKSLP